jgi:hypothetical protein
MQYFLGAQLHRCLPRHPSKFNHNFHQYRCHAHKVAMGSRKQSYKLCKSTKRRSPRQLRLTDGQLLCIAESKKVESNGLVSAEPEPLKYVQLESSKHIRILKLEPSPDRSTPLRFSFQTGTLKNLQHQYEAISYTQGDSGFPHRFHSVDDDTVISITLNLDSALRRFRDAYRIQGLCGPTHCAHIPIDLKHLRKLGCLITRSSKLNWDLVIHNYFSLCFAFSYVHKVLFSYSEVLQTLWYVLRV